jgi:hypothetical protein
MQGGATKPIRDKNFASSTETVALNYILDLCRGVDASGLLLANCTDAQLRITANVQLQYLLVYNMSSTSISPLVVDTDASLTLVNAVFLGNSVTGVPQSNASLYASAIYLNGSARLEASGLVVQGNAQRFTPPAAAHSQQDSPPFTASVIATTEGCPAVVAYTVFVGNGVRRDGGAATGSGTALHLNRYGTANEEIPACNITLYTNTFIGNMAQEWGGAVWVWGWQTMPVNITQNVFVRNRVISSSDLDCSDTTMAGYSRGGAMVVDPDQGTVSLSRNHWVDNHACVLGGALYAASSQGVRIDSDVFESNSAMGGLGGALVLQAIKSGVTTINSVRFIHNTAQRGGALFADRLALDVTDTMFMHNIANFTGGGLQCDGCLEVRIERWVALGITLTSTVLQFVYSTGCDSLGGRGMQATLLTCSQFTIRGQPRWQRRRCQHSVNRGCYNHGLQLRQQHGHFECRQCNHLLQGWHWFWGGPVPRHVAGKRNVVRCVVVGVCWWKRSQTSREIIVVTTGSYKDGCVHLQVGDARAVLASQSREGTIPSAHLTNCNFTGNSATNGGAVLYALACPHADRVSCQALHVSGSETSMEKNTVEGGSGADLWMVEVSTA